MKTNGKYAQRAGSIDIMILLALATVPSYAQTPSGDSLPATPATITQRHHTQSPSASPAGLSSLPADAQGPVSAKLGGDNSRYWAHANAAGFRAKNPQHGLVVDFTRQGAGLHSQNMRLGLETRGYGYGDALLPLGAATPHANANRVEYQRDGVTEWYENGPLGLEQGFTLAHRPGKANGEPLTVELGLRGDDLVASLQPDGKALELKTKDGNAALCYTGLIARDARGRELRSWLEVRGERLLVRVDDREARYPVVVDPWLQQAELTASDGQAGDYFGWSVAVSGSTAVVGAWCHAASGNCAGQGAAYVFAESAGTWSQQAELTASDGQTGDAFGYSVAVSGNTAVVGAIEGVQGPGKAYVFVESGGTWSQQAKLTASDAGPEDRFGWSVAVSGSTAVVGDPHHLVNGTGPYGSAYVFAQSGGTWSQQQELTASDGALDDNFGISVAVSGSTVMVGNAYHYAQQGAAYVFVGSGGAWSQQAELTASDGTIGDLFGISVAVSGSTAVVGASGHSDFRGGAYVFQESDGTWKQQAELTASDGKAGDGFGLSVAVSGSTAVVGAEGHSDGQGAAYVFLKSDTTWRQQAELTASNGAIDGLFGFSVAVSGSTAVVGAPKGGSNPAPGAAYVFDPQAYGVSGSNGDNSVELKNGKPCCAQGTLGAMVLKGQTSYILSNDHVLGWPTSATENSYKPINTVVYPGLKDTSCKPATTVATNIVAPTLSSGVDAAIAEVIPGAFSSAGEILNIGVPSTVEAPPLNMLVAKQGATTGLTCGKVTAVNMEENVFYTNEPNCNQADVTTFKVHFNDQIEIQTTSGTGFSQEGDSGSLIVDSITAGPIGLLVASNATKTVANPILDVLNRLGVTIGGGAVHSVEGCPHSEVETLMPESERLRALEVKNSLSVGIWDDPAILGIGVSAAQDDPSRGAVLILVRKGSHTMRAFPDKVNGVPIRIEYTEPLVVGLEKHCSSKGRSGTKSIGLLDSR